MENFSIHLIRKLLTCKKKKINMFEIVIDDNNKYWFCLDVIFYDIAGNENNFKNITMENVLNFSKIKFPEMNIVDTKINDPAKRVLCKFINSTGLKKYFHNQIIENLATIEHIIDTVNQYGKKVFVNVHGMNQLLLNAYNRIPHHPNLLFVITQYYNILLINSTYYGAIYAIITIEDEKYYDINRFFLFLKTHYYPMLDNGGILNMNVFKNSTSMLLTPPHHPAQQLCINIKNVRCILDCSKSTINRALTRTSAEFINLERKFKNLIDYDIKTVCLDWLYGISR